MFFIMVESFVQMKYSSSNICFSCACKLTDGLPVTSSKAVCDQGNLHVHLPYGVHATSTNFLFLQINRMYHKRNSRGSLRHSQAKLVEFACSNFTENIKKFVAEITTFIHSLLTHETNAHPFILNSKSINHIFD